MPKPSPQNIAVLLQSLFVTRLLVTIDPLLSFQYEEQLRQIAAHLKEKLEELARQQISSQHYQEFLGNFPALVAPLLQKLNDLMEEKLKTGFYPAELDVQICNEPSSPQTPMSSCSDDDSVCSAVSDATQITKISNEPGSPKTIKSFCSDNDLLSSAASNATQVQHRETNSQTFFKARLIYRTHTKEIRLPVLSQKALIKTPKLSFAASSPLSSASSACEQSSRTLDEYEQFRILQMQLHAEFIKCSLVLKTTKQITTFIEQIITPENLQDLASFMPTMLNSYQEIVSNLGEYLKPSQPTSVLVVAPSACLFSPPLSLLNPLPIEEEQDALAQAWQHFGMLIPSCRNALYSLFIYVVMSKNLTSFLDIPNLLDATERENINEYLKRMQQIFNHVYICTHTREYLASDIFNTLFIAYIEPSLEINRIELLNIPKLKPFLIKPDINVTINFLTKIETILKDKSITPDKFAQQITEFLVIQISPNVCSAQKTSQTLMQNVQQTVSEPIKLLLEAAAQYKTQNIGAVHCFSHIECLQQFWTTSFLLYHPQQIDSEARDLITALLFQIAGNLRKNNSQLAAEAFYILMGNSSFLNFLASCRQNHIYANYLVYRFYDRMYDLMLDMFNLEGIDLNPKIAAASNLSLETRSILTKIFLDIRICIEQYQQVLLHARADKLPTESVVNFAPYLKCGGGYMMEFPTINNSSETSCQQHIELLAKLFSSLASKENLSLVTDSSSISSSSLPVKLTELNLENLTTKPNSVFFNLLMDITNPPEKTTQEGAFELNDLKKRALPILEKLIQKLQELRVQYNKESFEIMAIRYEANFSQIFSVLYATSELISHWKVATSSVAETNATALAASMSGTFHQVNITSAPITASSPTPLPTSLLNDASQTILATLQGTRI